MFSNYGMQQSELLLRLLIAAILGIAIGYERENRMKEAGIRTHFIVATGASLMMIVSKYGFQDQIGWANMSLDPSRIAAQVVTGVGFLGAGIIFTQRKSIIGLTTAAGIWATAGIGLAIGAGLYLVGFAATITIILGQIILHSKIKVLASPKTEILTLKILDEPGAIHTIEKIFEERDINILNFKTESSKELVPVIDMKISIRVSESFSTTKLLCILQDNPIVVSVEF
ncbi:MgtC/SapB family protein [Clostridium psychrophilum]|uniref:MgtC/SapB family protein n=1 Tax=Clostridium psychrophilum TaxID=132926 RepID=UPI001C0B52DE|nr:MgtC/SapB family protein [Clostridium psychrophilum]MBU3179747.1 MgtC/SapB family protein [Clostridium psychrophilum]